MIFPNNEMIEKLQAENEQLKAAVKDLVDALRTTWPGEQGVAVELYHIAFLDRHKDLITKINEVEK